MAKKPIGRPSKFTDAIAREICERLSKGEPLAAICRDEHMPAVRTVSDWKVAHPEFSAAIARARDDGFDEIASGCLEIADEVKADPAEVQKAKLRVETRLKLLAKWDPRRYGERLDLNHSGSVQTIPDEQVDARIEALLAKANAGAD